MELDKNMYKEDNKFETWEKHINEKIRESLKNAIKRMDSNGLEEIQIKDMASIDSIEDKIVKCELLNGDMIEIKKGDFIYNIEEGDIINLNLTYKEGRLMKTQILDKNEEEKRLRIKIMQEKIRITRRKVNKI